MSVTADAIADADLASAPASKGERRLVIAGLALTQVIGWGTTFYPIAVIGNDVGRDLHLPSEAVYAGLTAMMTVSALLSPRIGRMLDRNGARAIMSAGSVVAALALVLLSQAGGLIPYLLGWMAIGLVTPMALGLAAFTATTQVMGADARRAITTLTFFSGISSTVFWPIIEHLSGTIGWRPMQIGFALLHLCICLPVHWFVLPRREVVLRRRAANVKPDMQGVLPAGKRMLAFILLATSVSLHGMVGWGLVLHFIEMFKALGLPAATAVWVASFNGVMQISARGGEIASGGRHSPVLTGLIAVALQPLGFLALIGFGASTLTAALFIMFYGLSAGLMTIARNALPLYLFGREGYGGMSGRLTLPQNLVFGIAPVLFAFVLERSGPHLALWIAFLSSVAAGVAMAFLARDVKRQRAR